MTFHLARTTSFLFLLLKAAIVILTKALLHRGVGSVQYVSKYKGIRTGPGTESVLYTCWLIVLVMKLMMKHHHVTRKEEHMQKSCGVYRCSVSMRHD